MGRKRNRTDWETRSRRRGKSGLERIVGGLTWGVVLYVLWTFHFLPLPFGWIVFLGVVGCVLPIVGGIRRSVGELEDRRMARAEAIEDQKVRQGERKDSLEKIVLQIAKERRGIVTPALVVLHSDLQLEEAERVLGDLASRGYAEMRIKDNGTIDYVFHDLT